MKNQGAKGELQTGAVTLIQRFGGSLNANPHFHSLVLEGAYVISPDGKAPKFRWVEAPTDDDIKVLIKTIALRVIRYFKRQGHFRDNTPYLGEETKDDELFPELQAASVQSKIATGERKGIPVRRLGSLGRVIDEDPVTKAPLCAAIQGFSPHAGVYCAPWERERLEKVTRYIARPSVSEERCRFASSGEIIYKVKRSYTDGTSHLLFTPLELIEKLAALVPQPRVHLARFSEFWRHTRRSDPKSCRRLKSPNHRRPQLPNRAQTRLSHPRNDCDREDSRPSGPTIEAPGYLSGAAFRRNRILPELSFQSIPAAAQAGVRPALENSNHFSPLSPGLRTVRLPKAAGFQRKAIGIKLFRGEI